MKATLIALAMVATTYANAQPYWQQQNSDFSQSGMIQMEQVPTESAQGKGKGKHHQQTQQPQQQQQQQQQQSPSAQQQQADVTTHAASYPVNPPPRPDYDY